MKSAAALALFLSLLSLPAFAQAPDPSLAAVKSEHGFVIPPGGTDRLTFTLHSRAQAPVKGAAQFDVVDLGGKVVRTEKLDVTLAPGADTDVAYAFDSAGLGEGEYAVRLSVDADGRRVLGVERSVMVAGKEALFVLFDKEPIARGIAFDRAGMSPAEVEVDGYKRWIWRLHETRGADGWWHSTTFTVTDERFRGGKRPVADLALTFRHEANAPLSLMADTAGGSKQVAGGWGRNPGWQTMRAEVDDAVWQARKTGADPKKLLTDGCDLRFNACTADGEIRSLSVRGYDLDQPDWHRLLRFDGLDAGRERFLFSPGEKQEFRLKLRNLANLPLQAGYTVRLNDDMGLLVWSRDEQANVPANSAFGLPVRFDAAGLKQGVYALALSLGRGSKEKREELLATEVSLMVSEQSPIARAKPGEFLYGLDTGIGADERFLPWADFMGADIVRHPGADRPDELEKALATLARYHLKSAMMFDPPWDEDPAKREQRTYEMAGRALEIARRFAGRIPFYELGNEPDLTFFYPGPMEAYVKGYEALYHAVKAGAPKACVMNGGLCFFGPDGDKRARRFVELVPKEAIDAFAYHGHGPLVGAERAAFTRMRDCARAFGKGDKTFVETESGVAAHTPAQIRMQARTAIEKMVYAQSVGLPTFYWFRLYITGGDGDYTNLKNAAEPRPVILSYRTMVKTLRGHAFVRKVDLGSPDYEGYLFAQKQGDGRALVVWADARAGGRRMISLAGKPGAVRDCRLVDLFGNAVPLKDAASGTVSMTVGDDPAFLAWRSSEPASVVSVLPSPLEVPPLVHLLPGGRDTVAVRVRNHSKQVLSASLALAAGPRTGVKPLQAQVPVTVPAGGAVTVRVPVTVAATTDAVNWPRRWSVFTNLPADSVAPGSFAAIPEKLEAKGQTFTPKVLALKEDRLDLAGAAGGYKEKAEALCFAVLDSPAARTIRIGASADFWMAWYVNGRHVYDTLEKGNGGGYAITDHQFEAPLKAGRNLLAVRVLSGSQGFKLLCAGPDELAAASGGLAPNRLTFSLRRGAAELARESAGIALIRRLPGLAGAAWPGTPADWTRREPDGEFGETGIVNPHAAQPDSSRWWKGLADLSGRVWLRADEKRLYVVVAVRDDVYRPAQDAAGIARGDAIRLAFAAEGAPALQLGVPGAGGAVYRQAGGKWSSLPAGRASAAVERVDTQEEHVTWYRVSIARTLLPGTRLAANALLNDDDWGEHKQSVSWQPGFDAPAAAEGWEQVVVP